MTAPARGRLVLGLALTLLAASCTGGADVRPFVSGGGGGRPVAPAPTASPEPIPSPGPLCTRTLEPPAERPEDPGPLPDGAREVLEQVEDVRELEFRRPVAVEASTRAEIDAVIRESLDQELPPEETARRERVWAAMGAIPEGTSLREVLEAFGTSQVVGLYTTGSDRLLFLGDDVDSAFERLVLAHELTHALDDQRFDLRLSDRLAAACQEERLSAYLALVEGNAQATSFRWAAEHFSPEDFLDLAGDIGAVAPPPASVPPFVQRSMEAPYIAGQAFVETLLARGGFEAVDRAFEDPPISTEQVLHPERYPQDRPQGVTPPDLAPALGAGWEEIDAMDVGESWLLTLLQLRLGTLRSEEAAEGWDGGRYRAFERDDSMAVVLQTVWDSPRDASEFAEEMQAWLADGDEPATITTDADRVTVLFASDEDTLRRLEGTAF